ncbi:very long chain fatty acid elongase F isoform X2 [Drosophila kikkawai]|uniref:Elongation of very long chain fatty acids protein n=1 Tax=Drosophila kikkawai TaxID=30033 RepID=A0ABM3C7Q7_DROKI|nr:elongation of very long chain fatty acids protein F isoform X2 [Drosophila kikkawai]
MQAFFQRVLPQAVLADSPWPILTILAVYLLFVLKLGKIFMENRKPYDLKRVLMFYNLFQVAYNGLYFGGIFYYMFIKQICNLRCLETFPQDHEHKQVERIFHAAYLLNKVLDLMDTVFFILRKSYKQVTFLHIYHHVLVAFAGFALTRTYGTGGHLNSLALLNTMVHMIMYFYYFLSSQYPSVKGSIWWKKYITLTQLIQFTLLLAYGIYVRFFSPNCGVPHGVLYVTMLQAVIFIYLFGTFYIQTYLQTSKSSLNNRKSEVKQS